MSRWHVILNLSGGYRGALLELFCAVLFTAIVPDHMHAHYVYVLLHNFWTKVRYLGIIFFVFCCIFSLDYCEFDVWVSFL